MDSLLIPLLARLAADANLRDACVAWLDSWIIRENALDRVDANHNVDHQKGRVAMLRVLRQTVVARERP